MNIQQFQYVLALAEYRHFETAAEKCFVSQSTLSTMIAKFEDEMGITVFDRKRKPVGISKEGSILIDQIQRIQKEIASLHEVVHEIKGEVKGTLSIAVIPTIAPFLLPKFLHHFAHQFPKLSIEVREQNTAEIIRNLRRRELDIGILSTPLKEPELKEYPLYDEPFVFFNMKQNAPTTVQPQQLDVSQICLLEEGHCMRTQVLELCDFYDKDLQDQLNFRFRAGSVHSLLRFVVANQASTLLPALATMELSEGEKNKVSHFESPIPYRSVGLVVHRHFVKNKIRELLQKEIQSVIHPLLDQVKSGGTQLQPVKT